MATTQTKPKTALYGADFFVAKKPKALKNVVSIQQFRDKDYIDSIFAQAARFKQMKPADYPKSLQHKVVATLFYEPSTRTRLSFEAAVQNLAGQIISTENAGQFSSAAKGETLEDTIRTINGYTDAIILRHPMLGAAELASKYSEVPIVNAGDGAGEHPTQALLDLFTILENKQTVDGLKIALVGDLLNGRTIHSLIHLLSLYKPHLYLIAPDVLQLPGSYLDILKQAGVTYSIESDWDDVLLKLDVLYLTRVQKERFETLQQYESVKNSFIFDGRALSKLHSKAVIMHPLPRVNEIATEVDDDPRAIYFEQARNGLFVRMALLEAILV